MRKRIILTALSVFSFSVFAFTFEKAQSIYLEKFIESPHSVQECGDYVFVILEGVNDFNSDRDFKGAVLEGQLKAIEKYIGKSSGGVTSPFRQSITAQLIPLAGFRIPECKSCKIDESKYMTKYRHVSAFEAGPLQKARKEVLSGTPASYTTDEWRKMIDLKLKAVSTDKERRLLWAEIGAVSALLSRFGGVKWTVENVDGVLLEKAVSEWKGDEPIEKCYSILRLNPAFSPALYRLVALAEKDKQWGIALCRRFSAAVGAADVDGILNVSQKCSEKYGSPAWREYASLYERAIRENTFVRETSAPFWRYVLNTFGHLKFSNASGDESSKAASLFAESKMLFSQGRELDRILEMLRQSIELQPGSAEKWRYYAAALRAAKRDLDAIVAYHQALTINLADERALADVCLLYNKLGCTELAKGIAWYVLVNCKDGTLLEKVKPLSGDSK